MIGIFIIVFTLILAFVDKPHLLKKPYNIGKIFLTVLLLGTAVFSIVKEVDQNRVDEHNTKTIDSISHKADSLNGLVSYMSRQVVDFRSETEIAQKALFDSTSSYHTDNKEEIKEVAYKMTKIFGETSKMNHEEHEKTRKQMESVSGSKPAYVHLISEPHNCYKTEIKNDTLTVTAIIENAGDLPAYNLSITGDFIILVNGVYYNIEKDIELRHSLTLAASDRVPLILQFLWNRDLQNTVKEYWFVIRTAYYVDYAAKEKREDIICPVHSAGSDELYIGKNPDYMLRTAINGLPNM